MSELQKEEWKAPWMPWMFWGGLALMIALPFVTVFVGLPKMVMLVFFIAIGGVIAAVAATNRKQPEVQK